jgi:hypothetical protein
MFFVFTRTFSTGFGAQPAKTGSTPSLSTRGLSTSGSSMHEAA